MMSCVFDVHAMLMVSISTPSVSITHILISVGLHEPIDHFRNMRINMTISAYQIFTRSVSDCILY